MSINRARRLVKVYGTPRDPKTIARLERERKRGRIRRTHRDLDTSVKPEIKGDIHNDKGQP